MMVKGQGRRWRQWQTSMTCIVCNGTIGRAPRLASLPRPGLVVVPLLTLCAEAVLASEDVCFPLLYLHLGFCLCGPS